VIGNLAGWADCDGPGTGPRGPFDGGGGGLVDIRAGIGNLWILDRDQDLHRPKNPAYQDPCLKMALRSPGPRIEGLLRIVPTARWLEEVKRIFRRPTRGLQIKL